MGRYEDEVREEMDRAADTARGLGMSLGVEDMRYFADELGYAAMADDMNCREEAYRYFEEEHELDRQAAGEEG